MMANEALKSWGREEAKTWRWVGRAVFFLFMVHLIDRMIPGTYWYSLDRVLVQDTPVGEVPKISVDHTVHRSFNGRYEVTLWSADLNSYICRGSDTLRYSKSQGILSKDLTWWVANQRPLCMDYLSEGQYTMQTCVFIRPAPGLLGSVLSEREVCRWSNIFTIYNPADKPIMLDPPKL